MSLWFRGQKFKIILILFALWGGIFYFWGEVEAAEPGDIVINEVAPWESSSQDWVEFYATTDIIIDKWVVKERDAIIKIFPNTLSLSQGDYIILHINQSGENESNESGKGENNCWDFYSQDEGVVGTDNVITLEDADGMIIDALCWVKIDETWTKGQKMAFENVIEAEEWVGTIDTNKDQQQSESFDATQGQKKNISIGRDKLSSDHNNENDWDLFTIQTPGKVNNQLPEIVSLEVDPSSVLADGESEIFITTEVSDPDGLEDIESVKVDLSQISGSSSQKMDDNGDGIYDFSIIVSEAVSPGSYTLDVVVRDKNGDIDGDTIEIEVITSNQPPEAEIIADKTNVSVGETINFDASDSSDPDEDILSYTWDFGDEEGSEEMNPTHTYSSPGTYTVSLTVSDGELSNTDTLIITVNEPVYSDDIRINEFLPNPEGSDTENEWIELYNNSSSEVDISGWIIDDEEGGSTPHTFPQGTKITAQGYLVIYRSESNIALNNNGDEVRLFHPDGNLVDQVSFSESVKEDFSYNQTLSDIWAWSEELTPGEKNEVVSSDNAEEDEEESEGEDENEENNEEQIEVIDIKTARSEEKGSAVKVGGIITVIPGVLSNKYFYIQDKSSGIQIYSYEEDFPELKLGDKVEVQGEISFSEAKIKISSGEDINILSSGDIISSKLVETGKIDESLEGMLVTVSGQVAKTSGSTFYLDDGSGEVKVYIIKSTEIKKPEMGKGDWFTITGIVSETSSGYRILPRYQDDVREGTAEGVSMLPATGASLDNILWISVVLVFLIVWYNKVSSKLKVKSSKFKIKSYYEMSKL